MQEAVTTSKIAGFGTAEKGFMSEGLTIESTMTDETVNIPDSKDPDDALKYQGLVALVLEHFRRAEEQRQWDERRWIKCYQNYRGLPTSDGRFTKTERSEAFIKVTKTKVLAAYSQIIEVIFSQNKFPIGIEPALTPEVLAESVHFDPKEPQAGTPQIPVARSNILEMLGPLKKGLERIKDKIKDGPGLTPSALTWEPAKMAAKKMERKVHDQLLEAGANKSLRHSVFEACLLGSLCYKGPLAQKKEYPRWDADGNYVPEVQTIADVQHVSLWNAYPDPDAKNMDEAEFFIERHKLNRTQLRALKSRPAFRDKVIERVITQGPNYHPKYWEHSLTDGNVEDSPQCWEVLEYWGIVDKEIAEQADLTLPKEFKDADQIQINAWICNGEVLRLAFNPFKPARIPYFIAPYELNPYSIFGVGVAENMEDTQMLMNGFMRLMVDNGVLSSNVVFEVNKTYLMDGQDMEIHPGKILYTEGQQSGFSVNSLKFDNVTQECILMFDKARQLADEATGIPSYSHGQSGIQSTGRTAAGMSMLMNASAQNIKTVIKNLDDYCFYPLGQGMFAFNMQFNFDKEFIGDVKVVARGTESLMRNEIRSQKILQALQVTGNPMDAPFVKRDYLLRELFDALDIDSEKSVNDLREAGIQAEVMKEMMLAQGIDPSKQGQGGGGNPAGAPNPQDPTGNGGGNIAPGAAPPPGAPGYSGGGGGANGGPKQQKAA